MVKDVLGSAQGKSLAIRACAPVHPVRGFECRAIHGIKVVTRRMSSSFLGVDIYFLQRKK